MSKKGKLYGIGVGPGDPELLTIKALRTLEQCDIIAYHQAKNKKSNALTIVEPWLKGHQQHLPLVYPITTELHQDYEGLIKNFYEIIEIKLRHYLDLGKNISVLAEGDPLFYSSFMYIYNRLGHLYETEIIPGVTSVSGAAAALGAPLCYRNQSLTILSATLEQEILEQYLAADQAFVIMKIGRHIEKIRHVTRKTGLFERAFYIERATTSLQKIMLLSDVFLETAPYFSLILIPGKERTF